MPTKHRRHAITETPRLRAALDPLREELNGERLDLLELVVIGAEAKLADLRADDDHKRALREDLVRRIRSGELDVDPALADEAKRSWIPEEASGT